ncbi:MAG: hypothetical protein ACOYMD_09490 [Paludibacter sp.]
MVTNTIKNNKPAAISTKQAPPKKVSKAWKAAMKYQGCFDRDEVIKFAHS